MKFALLAALVSFSAMATDCFVRQDALVMKNVTLAQEICINELTLKPDYFGISKVEVKYTLDGVDKVKVVELSKKLSETAGKLEFLAYGLDFSAKSEGACESSVKAAASGKLSINRDGSGLELTSIIGSLTYTPDTCHSPVRELQTVKYNKI